MASAAPTHRPGRPLLDAGRKGVKSITPSSLPDQGSTGPPRRARAGSANIGFDDPPETPRAGCRLRLTLPASGEPDLHEEASDA